MSDGRPILALALGDAAGISTELAAKVLADQELRNAARFVIIGDRRQMAAGEEVAGVQLDIGTDRFLDTGNLDQGSVTYGEASAITGGAAVENFATALQLADVGGADAVCFTPFNKYAMRLARPDYVDEIGFIQATLGTEVEGSEFNVLDELWNARVTSHIPLGEVAETISEERVLQRIKLTDQTMRNAGFPRPRIGVAALNPHAGDNGNFGSEEDEVIAPAVKRAQELQINVSGPWPSDTVYWRAVKGEFDVVLSMYHDQGQIAIKLLGFERGVSLIGGYPFWIATPAHGTAYDIAGKGIANPQATKNALMMAAKLASASERERADESTRDIAIEAVLESRLRPVE